MKVSVTWSCLLFVTPWTVAARLLCPWDSPGKNTGVGCHALLQGIFPTQGLNPGLPHCRQILYCLSHEVNTSLFFCSCCCSCGPGSFFIWLLYPFDILPLLLHGLLFSCFYALPCFLTLQDALG